MPGRRDFFTKILGGAVAAVVAPYLPPAAPAAALTAGDSIFVPRAAGSAATSLASLADWLKRIYSDETFEYALNQHEKFMRGRAFLAGTSWETYPDLSGVSSPRASRKRRKPARHR
jgi:hypothetical protein